MAETSAVKCVSEDISYNFVLCLVPVFMCACA